LRNHPSRHRKERDDAALLTQEGNTDIPLRKSHFGRSGEKLCFAQRWNGTGDLTNTPSIG